MAHPNCTMSANAIKCLPQTLNDLTKYASARCMVVDYVVAFNPCLLQMNFASQNETVPLPFSAAFTSECCCTDKMYISICFKHTKWKYKTDTYMRKTGSPFGWITNNAAMWQTTAPIALPFVCRILYCSSVGGTVEQSSRHARQTFEYCFTIRPTLSRNTRGHLVASRGLERGQPAPGDPGGVLPKRRPFSILCSNDSYYINISPRFALAIRVQPLTFLNFKWMRSARL